MMIYPLETKWKESGYISGGGNTVDNVTNVIGRFLLLVKSGLPNFVFPFHLCFINYFLNKGNKQQ